MVLALATIVLNLCDSSLLAADSWRDGEYAKIIVEGEAVPVVKLLRDFGQAQRVPVIIAAEITGDVATQYPKLSPEEYLNTLCRDNSLFWFERNAAIYVYPNSQLKSRIIPIGKVSPARIVEVLRRFQLYSESFPLKADTELGLIYVTGSDDYLNEVEGIIQRMVVATGGDPSVAVEVQVYRLQYASADDRTFTLGDREVYVPGVATILRNVLTGRGQDGISGRVSTQLPRNRPGLRGSGLIGPYNQLIASTQEAAVDSQVAAAQAEARFQAAASAQEQINQALSQAEAGRPDYQAQQQAANVEVVIQADSRINAIIIKDVRSRLDSYAEIIRRLDQPVSLVEIKASIIDVDATKGLEFGLPSNVIFNRDGTQRSIVGNLSTQTLASVAAPGNLSFQLADGAVNQLLVNLRALESDGHARLIAKPSVVTLDNQDAFLEESEEFFVRVAGNEQVDLFNVIVGTKLNITPHIIRGYGSRQIRLSVNIEDGSRSATQQVDQIPVVSRNTINTQAVLVEGQSLLVGGLTREGETKNIRAVPVLGRIPLVGAMFRETVHQTTRLERLILLKPTIIDLPCFEHPGQPPMMREHYPTAPPETRAPTHYAPTPTLQVPAPDAGPPTLPPPGPNLPGAYDDLPRRGTPTPEPAPIPAPVPDRAGSPPPQAALRSRANLQEPPRMRSTQFFHPNPMTHGPVQTVGYSSEAVNKPLASSGFFPADTGTTAVRRQPPHVKLRPRPRPLNPSSADPVERRVPRKLDTRQQPATQPQAESSRRPLFQWRQNSPTPVRRAD